MQTQMEQRISEVAQRIKELREILEISVAEMAECTSVSTDAYAEFEAGKADFSFTFIHKCAQKFGVDATDLLKGSSPTLRTYCVNKKGTGLPIARRKGFSYNNLAPLFKEKIAEPFYVTAVYAEDEQNAPIKLSRHAGQEFNLILEGTLKIAIDGHIEVLSEGDSIYYDSATPHGMIAADGADCKFLAVVINSGGAAYDYPSAELTEVAHQIKKVYQDTSATVAGNFIETDLNEDGILKDIRFKNAENYNFAFDTVDAIADKNPTKLAMLHIDREHNERRFTFGDMKKHSNKTANYFKSLGIGRGDRVMLVLKRHYQFWFSILALHKLGAVVIPATNLLVEKDFEYRFHAAGVKALICTADGDVAHQADLASVKCPEVEIKVIAKGERDGWHSFDKEVEACSDVFDRPSDISGGEDTMLMFFTSGTTGYPKIASHKFTYPLGHYITARYWNNVDPDGIHLTISDTGWGKALWGKLYGQWLCEAAIFTYDFDRFDAHDILPMFAKYNITTFCAPPTMYRFFIKEDLSEYDLSSLSHATVAGEALNPEVFQQWYKATGLKLMEGFGQTETTLLICNLAGENPKPGSMGKPSPMYEVDIVAPDGTSVKDGETGEIVVKTANSTPFGLFTGYYKAEEQTASAWHDGAYHTGDTAWKDEDGHFWYVGRVDDLIKSSGYRIGPFEIESVIMELPYILECAVTAAPDEIRGQVVKASIVLIKSQTPSDTLKKEIQTYVKEHTAPYKYPRIIEFLDELPKTISGKIRRVELRK